MKATALLLVLSIALVLQVTQARERAFVDEASTNREDLPEPEMWKEGGVQLPPYPQEEDLLEFWVDDPQERFRYLIDGKNLSVGADGVVRYTLVIRSPRGADNVSFEGMRCDTREFKTYAYGARGEFKPIKAPVWERLKKTGPYRYHLNLRQLYFCQPMHFAPYAAEEIMRLLGETPRRVDDLTEDTGFL